MAKYNHKEIEPRWQEYWEKKKLFAADDKSSKPKFYCLIEFPYPSGDGLHVGHPRSNTAMDILARKRRMQGYNVLYPIGFDAFGLPSENYAIKTGIHPAITTEKNINTFTAQLKALGFSFDWDRVIKTTDPEYYKWTQWIFLKMHEKGLAYKDKMAINWCPSCKTGLANEEVINGHCERCGNEVEQREKEQWMLKITNYADRLIEDLDNVDYISQVKTQQINWIGKSEGAEIYFPVKDSKDEIKVYTTRPDTLFGATFLVLSPEHEMVSDLTSDSQKNEIEEYISQASKKSEQDRTDFTKEKTGVFTGSYAINPATQEEIPIWIADYVLAGYGKGAIMSVPAHDSRDFAFAQKYGLENVHVIEPDNKNPVDSDLECWEGEGVLKNSGEFNGLNYKDGASKIVNWLEENNLGEKAVNYKIRDWVFSRQRYWGEPIPMVYCENCLATGASSDGWIRVPEKELPIVLPQVEKYEPTDDGGSPLAVLDDWVNVKCPTCGGDAKRETDTMPNWAGSNWYFLRYIDPRNNKELADDKKIEYWAPVDWYNGGMEHTTLHLLYSRFVYKFLWDIGVVPKSVGSEPYLKRTSHGIILGENNEKMSKSKGNVVNPDEIVDEYGADTLRLYEMFMGPFDQAIPWSAKGVAGARRFLEKVWYLYDQAEIIKDPQEECITLTHQTIKKVSEDIETQDYNTAISAMMILVNKLSETNQMNRFIADSLLKILFPFAPHITEEIWSNLGNKKSISLESWPEFDEELIVSKEFDLIVQVNGKVRDKIKVPADITQQRAETLSQESDKVQAHLQGKEIKNIIFVPGRLINFVV